jgi:hypothetical protein
MLELDEEAIRQRARELAERGAVEDPATLLRRARAEMERELRARTRDAGEVHHRMNPPLELDEALDPSLPHGEKKWKAGAGERGAG